MNFNDPQTWKNYDAANQAELRFAKLLSLLDPTTINILDVGSGNGLITNKLHDRFEVSAMDISEAALQSVICPKVVASITSIPFADNSFATLNCNEVLEHLTDQELTLSLTELKRVAQKHIIIGVPHQEQLPRYHYRCAVCGNIEHPYGHLQSFDDKRLNALLEPEFYLKKRLVYGPSEIDYIPLLLYIRQYFLKQWFNPYDACSCSRCGSTSFDTRKNPITKLLNGLNRLIMKPRPYWFLGLYERKGAGI